MFRIKNGRSPRALSSLLRHYFERVAVVWTKFDLHRVGTLAHRACSLKNRKRLGGFVRKPCVAKSHHAAVNGTGFVLERHHLKIRRRFEYERGFLLLAARFILDRCDITGLVSRQKRIKILWTSERGRIDPQDLYRCGRVRHCTAGC